MDKHSGNKAAAAEVDFSGLDDNEHEGATQLSTTSETNRCVTCHFERNWMVAYLVKIISSSNFKALQKDYEDDELNLQVEKRLCEILFKFPNVLCEVIDGNAFVGELDNAGI